jgi:GNAT superfamily N-acetyltransferase
MSLSTDFVELNKTIHDRGSFDCGENDLNLFIKRQASKHMQVGISKTMVLPNISPQEYHKHRICAFYTIAPSSIKRESLPTKLAKNLPHYPVPVFLLAQMAIHIEHQGTGLGKITLIKALEYLWQVNSQMTAYAIVVDCLNTKVQQFYEKYGFETLCDFNSKIRMYLPMKVVKNLFS